MHIIVNIHPAGWKGNSVKVRYTITILVKKYFTPLRDLTNHLLYITVQAADCLIQLHSA